MSPKDAPPAAPPVAPETAALFADIAQLFGLSRPAGACLAAIWRAAQAPSADDLVRGLGLARSNVSTALRDLRDWGLVTPARTPGDRRDYFTAPSDPWELLRLMMLARQRRRVEPLIDRLVQAEAASGDVRLAALHAVISDVAALTPVLAGSTGAALAQRLTALAEGPAPEKKKKKKKA